ncbi:MAG: hypothetical protein FRX48_06517 [Lasallia pustulata]|uniref:Uncharacterized protein n=1 Tax=Lasallia pustulata TaxID=136370 RepID=A0A5M8PN46_9LECA|nr:MAG: hypothetical protein FRX48_06517 [Lasallia pustulata]
MKSFAFPYAFLIGCHCALLTFHVCCHTFLHCIAMPSISSMSRMGPSHPYLLHRGPLLPKMFTNRSKKEPKNLLKNTSQGRKTDLPPKDWIVDELIKFGAIQTGREWNLNLKGKVHTIFDKKRWNIAQARYDALEQSFLLGTKLLEVGSPYLCNFLPDQNFLVERQRGFDEGVIRRLIVNDKRTKAEIDAANTVLVEIADSLQWEENARMLPDTGRFGLNHTSYIAEEGDKAIVPDRVTEEDPTYDWVEAANQALSAGQQHRQITITVASQYVDAILASKHNSDQHLIAVFLAAVNMVHELGHIIYYHDLRSDCQGFWVGDDINDETGHSFTAWLFDGCYPEPIHLGNDKDLYAMKTGVHWSKWYRKPVVKPIATYMYSIPLAHIQRLLDHNEWSKFDTLQESLRIRQELLRPKVPFRNGKHARTGRLLSEFAWSYGYAGFQERDDDDGDADFFSMVPKDDRLAVDEDWADGSEQGKLSTIHHLYARLTNLSRRDDRGSDR